jgi:hypothetical protein
LSSRTGAVFPVDLCWDRRRAPLRDGFAAGVTFLWDVIATHRDAHEHEVRSLQIDIDEHQTTLIDRRCG